MKFSKMHGLGNDFLIFEEDGKTDWHTIAKKVCARRVGVGADGIMVVASSDVADIRMIIINADGSEAEMCGNGIRCFAKYVYENDIVSKTDMTVETLAGIIKPKLTLQNGKVSGITVDMGKPSFERADIPMSGSGSSFDVPIDVDGLKVIVSALLMGVPHAVVLVDDIETTDTAVIGPKLEEHELFPQKINVNFMQVLDRDNVKVKTFERGAGFTLACGTGSCAVVAALYKKGVINSKATVHLEVGELVIEVLDDDTVLMSGSAEPVYTAQLQ
ncbi:MAG: diaminopimelate epimerase [Clostridia bacterium]|jgi:diaminopimelate epimerase|nr:diaminopimelate epimerase [Clostridia bacterium]MBT7123041.1 diaminopimelate epimerase [Clostridia bacterium]